MRSELDPGGPAATLGRSERNKPDLCGIRSDARNHINQIGRGPKKGDPFFDALKRLF